jgi:hypothetical protein
MTIQQSNEPFDSTSLNNLTDINHGGLYNARPKPNSVIAFVESPMNRAETEGY